jgi:diguanylate cyclase (GGDEF)-like protein
MLRRLGIRAQLLLLIGLAAAPLLALLLLGASLRHDILAREAEQELHHLVERIAAHHAALVREGEALVALLAAADVGPGADGRGCLNLVRRLNQYRPTRWRFSRLNRDGWLICATSGQARVNVRDEPYFLEAARTGKPLVGRYLAGRGGGAPYLPVVQPLRDAAGDFDGVVVAALPLAVLRELIAELLLPPGTRLQLVDHVGRLVTERADAAAPPLAPSEWLGHVDPLAARRVVRLDGRLAALSDVAGTGLKVAVALGEAQALGEASRRLKVELAVAFLALIGVGAVAVLLAERLFVRRIRHLAAAAGRLRLGDLTVRSELGTRDDEIGALARGLDAMATELERQHGRLRAREAQYRHLAMHDPLTDLANRRGFMSALEERVHAAAAHGGGLALLLVDLDEFKAVNDRFGHDAGDAVLVAAAARLRAAVRGRDLVARLAGDEFALLIELEPGLGRDVDGIARRLVESLSEPYALAGGEIGAAATVGLALFPEHAGDAEALLKAADVALYAGKLGGRRTWRRFDGEAGRAAAPA